MGRAVSWIMAVPAPPLLSASLAVAWMAFAAGRRVQDRVRPVRLLERARLMAFAVPFLMAKIPIQNVWTEEPRPAVTMAIAMAKKHAVSMLPVQSARLARAASAPQRRNAPVMVRAFARQAP
jgi:hypothetical protein